jgi:hypothetical protein
MSAIEDLRTSTRALREWQMDCRQRRLVLVARRVPVAKRMAAMHEELGRGRVEGETLSAFVERVLGPKKETT